jgi:hypothetical protein
MLNYIYDIETFPNVFTIVLKRHDTNEYYTFEISQRKNDINQLIEFIFYLRDNKAQMIGFNNIGFDYPILHFIIQNHSHIEIIDIYNKAASIINARLDDKFNHLVWDNDRYVDQIDLFKIHHFDNVAKFTSLKMLEFNMRSSNIQDLPFSPGTYLTDNEIDVLIDYNKNDVNETSKFFDKSQDEIKLRKHLTKQYNRNCLNSNDKKIGVDYLISEMEKIKPGSCYNKISGRRKPVQTHRTSIAFKDVIFPYIRFEHPEFIRIHEYLNNTTITETKNCIKNLNCTIDNFTFHFGTGGIHGSVNPCTVAEDEYFAIKDIDVTSYYPSIGIVNRVFPEHLGEIFCDLYADIKTQRMGYKKGSPENKMLKLSLNGSYGDSNNVYSPLYDPKYTMIITINGQLLLCLLAQYLMQIPELQMIQINTDGLSVKYPRHQSHQLNSICDWWKKFTCLDLEYNNYKRIFIRDVNNYIAESTDKKVKRKGVYEIEREWHKNQSSLVIQKAASAALLNNSDIALFIYSHKDIMDFMLRTKVPRSSKLYMYNGEDQRTQLQNITRYYISNSGGSLFKIMPPLKNKIKERKIGINVGWLTTECNNISNFRNDINMDYYIAETKKLVDPLIN